MQTAFTTDSSVRAGHPRPAPASAVAISADSLILHDKIEALAERAGARVVADGEKSDMLLLGVDASTSPQLLRDVAHSGRVCAIWVADEPPRNAILRILRAGIAGIISLASSPEQLKAALVAVRANLQIVDPQLTQAETAISVEAMRSEELTDREQQVLGMMAEGLANKEISSRLGISTHTVKFHISSILGKLGASSRTEAVSIGVRSGKVVI